MNRCVPSPVFTESFCLVFVWLLSSTITLLFLLEEILGVFCLREMLVVNSSLFKIISLFFDELFVSLLGLGFVVTVPVPGLFSPGFSFPSCVLSPGCSGVVLLFFIF